MNETCKLSYLQEIASQPMGVYMAIMVECPEVVDPKGRITLKAALEDDRMVYLFSSLEEVQITLVFDCPCIGKLHSAHIISLVDTKYYSVGMGKCVVDSLKNEIARMLFEY